MLWTKKEKTQPIVLVEKTIQKIKKTLKKVVDTTDFPCQNTPCFRQKTFKVVRAVQPNEMKKHFKKLLKKCLTLRFRCDKIIKRSQVERQTNIDN